MNNKDRYYRKVKISIIVFLSGLAVSVFLLATKPKIETIGAGETAVPVSVISVKKESIHPVLRAYGKVNSENLTKISSAISAIVSEISVKEGNFVKKGNTLIILDNKDASLLLAERIAILSNAENVLAEEMRSSKSDRQRLKYQREAYNLQKDRLLAIESLKNGTHATEDMVRSVRIELYSMAIELERKASYVDGHYQRVKQLESKIELAKVQLQQAKINLDRTIILAPYDGRIVDVNVSLGDRTLIGATLVSMYDANNMVIEARISRDHAATLQSSLSMPDRLISHVKAHNLRIPITLDRIGDSKINESVYSKVAFFNANNKGGSLDVGQFVDLQITLPIEQDVFLVPIEAIYNGRKIYIVKDNKLHSISVKRAGEFVNGRQEQYLVRSDEIGSGDLIVSRKLDRPIDGVLVDVINSDLSVMSVRK